MRDTKPHRNRQPGHGNDDRDDEKREVHGGIVTASKLPAGGGGPGEPLVTL